MQKDGGWIFISHSHLDIELVRKIRNELEAKGFEPLLFYLKCLNDDSEIEDLIKREINEREWFIYVNSENSQNSKWVTSEREYIKTLQGKKIFTIDLTKDIYSQVELITRQLQVYISYSHKDSALEKQIRKKLLEHEFLVFDDSDICVGDDFSVKIQHTLDSSIRQGFVILLITNSSQTSEYIIREIEYVIANKGKIVPVYVDNACLNADALSLIGDIQGVHISSNPTQDELKKLVDSINHRIKYYNSDFTNLIGFQSATSIIYPHIGRIEAYIVNQLEKNKSERYNIKHE